MFVPTVWVRERVPEHVGVALLVYSSVAAEYEAVELRPGGDGDMLADWVRVAEAVADGTCLLPLRDADNKFDWLTRLRVAVSLMLADTDGDGEHVTVPLDFDGVVVEVGVDVGRPPDGVAELEGVGIDEDRASVADTVLVRGLSVGVELCELDAVTRSVAAVLEADIVR